MPVRKDETGNRSVEAHVEVPGSPEEVWHAIATGDGISSWFVPSTVEEREGGTIVNSFGPGMDAVSTIKAWQPPERFVAESDEESLKVATEWTVEARAGGTCVVRVVHRWFAETDDWDGQFEGHAYGWATSYFRMLQLYLAHYAGEPCSAFQLSAMSPESGPATWRTIKSALNIDGDDQRFSSTSETPELAGGVERMEIIDPDLLRVRESAPHVVAALAGMEGEEPELLLRLDRPSPGIAHLYVVPMGEQTLVSLRFHFFDAPEAAERAERDWTAWLAERFPQEATA